MAGEIKILKEELVHLWEKKTGFKKLEANFYFIPIDNAFQLKDVPTKIDFKTAQYTIYFSDHRLLKPFRLKTQGVVVQFTFKFEVDEERIIRYLEMIKKQIEETISKITNVLNYKNEIIRHFDFVRNSSKSYSSLNELQRSIDQENIEEQLVLTDNNIKEIFCFDLYTTKRIVVVYRSDDLYDVFAGSIYPSISSTSFRLTDYRENIQRLDIIDAINDVKNTMYKPDMAEKRRLKIYGRKHKQGEDPEEKRLYRIVRGYSLAQKRRRRQEYYEDIYIYDMYMYHTHGKIPSNRDPEYLKSIQNKETYYEYDSKGSDPLRLTRRI